LIISILQIGHERLWNAGTGIEMLNIKRPGNKS